MNIETERKFLVKSNKYRKLAHKSYNISQGYISDDPARSVRVRMKGNQGFLTIKGATDESGISRTEWEIEIDKNSFDALWPLCLVGKISKTRYEIAHDNHIVEIDEFHGENAGLIMAEIELKDKNDTVNLPDWLGQEVTHDSRYYNVYLSKHPYSSWSKQD